MQPLRIAEVPNKIAVPFENEQKVAPYEEALRLAGLEGVRVRTGEKRSLDGLDGLLLMGGRDVDPQRYGQQRAAETDEPNQALDEMEADLLRQAFDRDLPILAICRGMQLFNVCHAGGTLIQHIGGTHRVRSDDSSLPVHEIQVMPQTKLAEILGNGKHP